MHQPKGFMIRGTNRCKHVEIMLITEVIDFQKQLQWQSPLELLVRGVLQVP